MPIGGLINKDPWWGSQRLAPDKFPSFCLPGVENRDAMKALNQAIKKEGWRGVGGWICIEKSPMFPRVVDEQYYKERLIEADYAGWLTWKIDWGKDCRKYDVRRLITELRLKYAPNLIAEQAMLPELIPYADTFRTYDVFTLLAIPITLEKLSVDLAYDAAPGHLGLINCMDEVYTAAVLGCALDVTRHDMGPTLPNGQPDPSFPALHRKLKTKTSEVTRTVRWHRIAPAFSVNGSQTFIDPHCLVDCWDVVSQPDEIEAWWRYRNGDHIERKGPARISRSLPPAEVEPDKEGYVPFIISALHPCGAAAVGSLARTQSRRYFTPRCRVTQNIRDAELIGIFGYYDALILKSTAVRTSSRILAQDLLADEAKDITALCEIENSQIIIPGAVIETIGTECSPAGETAEPGMILKIENK